ncbi:unnamed protein product, partial [Oncorhynchus mykiss]
WGGLVRGSRPLSNLSVCLHREKDIEHFLETSRNKFIGFTLGNDTETLVGLPRPIHESVKTLKQHKYVSIAEMQIKREEELQQCPMTLGEEDVDETPTEILYLGMLPNLSQYVIALLKLLLAAAPTSKAKTDSINILADVLPEEMPITVLQSMKLGIDVNRHKEIIVKAISALLLLLLKHLKLNHIYQVSPPTAPTGLSFSLPLSLFLCSPPPSTPQVSHYLSLSPTPSGLPLLSRSHLFQWGSGG